jgi:type II secretory pathway pseudopilin PulG
MSGIGDGAARRDADAGTTLIEALAVVAITTVVSLVAFPRMQQSFLSMAQRQTLAAVAERLREARAAALGRDTPVSFVADGRSYGLSLGAASPVPSGIAVFVDGGRRVVFYGDGTSSGGVVRVRGGAQTLAVRITPDAGFVAADKP